MKKVRLSNFELLRIFAIFLVLLGHAYSIGVGIPSQQDVLNRPLASYGSILTSSIALGGVNIFVLISGWFGIRPSVKGFFKLLFQVFFLLWLIYIIVLMSGQTDFSVEGIKVCLGWYQGYWFVMAYLGLYILSPVLNAFIESASKKDFCCMLLTFYLFQCYFSWISSMVSYFEGYSITLFCGLYLTSRYLRLYPVRIVTDFSLAFYLSGIFLVSVLATISMGLLGHASRMLRYDNPMVILSCVCLVITISKFNLRNRFVNWLAASCFAVYLIHFNPLVFNYFLQGVRFVGASFCGLEYGIGLFAYLLLTFFLCVLIDQVRILFWRLIIVVKTLS